MDERKRDALERGKEKIRKAAFLSTQLPFRDAPLQSSAEVFPQLKIADFYGSSIVHDEEYIPITGKAQRKQNKRLKMKNASPVELNTLLKFDKGQISFVGPAGSGKSTLLKAITRDVIAKGYSALEGVEIVHFINCSEFQEKDEVNAKQFLFCLPSGLELHEDELDAVIEYAKAHPDRLLFILDSLDTLQCTPDGKHELTSLDEAVRPGIVLGNFLACTIFPGARIITSSREYAIREYVGAIRAEKVIALTGLSDESMKKIIESYLGESMVDEIMQNIFQKYPALKNLCATPVFLKFALLVIERREKEKERGYKSHLSTMTAVLVNLLDGFVRSPHFKGENVLTKLMELSFDGTKMGRVNFKATDLRKYELDPKTVSSLAITAEVSKLPINQKLMRGKQVVFFAHQSIQELLAAAFIVKMKADAFEKFLEKHIHSPRYAVVRRIVCGLLLDAELTAMVKDLFGDFSAVEKTDALLGSLQRELENTTKRADLLELYNSMFEANGDADANIIKSLTTLDLTGIPLSPSDVCVVGSVVSKCTKLDVLRMSNCSLDPVLLDTFLSCLQKSQVQISALYLFGNNGMAEGVSAVGRIVTQCHVEELYLEGCELTSQDLVLLEKELLEAKMLRILILSGNEQIKEEGALSVGQIVRQCGVTELYLQSCRLSRTLLENMQEGLGTDSKLKNLNISGNDQMEKEAVFIIGQIVNQCEVEILNLSSCQLTNEHVVALKRGIAVAKLRVLFLSGNHCIGVEGIISVGEIVRSCGLDEVYLQDCRASIEILKAFHGCLERAKMRKLFIGGEKTNITEKILSTLIKLTTNVTEVFAVLDWEIDETSLKELRQRSSSLGELTPKIVTSCHDLIESNQSQIVGPAGGEIAVNNCKVILPPNAVAREVVFDISSRNDATSFWKEGYVAVSPELKCKPSVYFSLPVKVQLPIWCSTENEIVQVHVFRYNERELEELSIQSLKDLDGAIAFECNHFSRFRVLANRALFGMLKFKLLVKIFFDSVGNLMLVFFHSSEKKTVDREMMDRKYEHMPLKPVTIRLRGGDDVVTTIEFQNREGGMINEPAKFSFTFSDQATFPLLYHQLEPVPDQPPTVRFQLCINNQEVEDVLTNVGWPAREPPGAAGVTIIADNIGAIALNPQN